MPPEVKGIGMEEEYLEIAVQSLDLDLLEQYANDPTLDVPPVDIPTTRTWTITTQVTFQLTTEEDPVMRVQEVLEQTLSGFTHEWTEPLAMPMDE